MQTTQTRFTIFHTVQICIGILLLCLAVWTPPLFAQSAALRLQEIELLTRGGARTVRFRFSQPPDSIKSFALSSPSRIVIDVHGPVPNAPSSVYQASDPVLTQVRTGSHPHRLRLVLDLHSPTAPRHAVKQQEASIIATLGEPDADAPPAQTQVLFSRSHTALASRFKPRRPAPPPVANVTPPTSSSAPPSRTQPSSPRAKTEPAPARQPLSKQARYHLEQGQILYDAGKLDEAIFQWRETLHLAPNTAQAHHLLGLAFRDQKNHTQAAEAFQQAIRLEPDNATMHVHLARAYESLGQEQEAFTTYKKSLQLVPSAPYVHNRLGYLLAAREDWQGAADEWYQTIQQAPNYAYAYANYGEALEKLGRKQDALTTYENAAPVCAQFTRAFKESGKKRKAEALCAEIRQRVARLQPVGS